MIKWKFKQLFQPVLAEFSFKLFLLQNLLPSQLRKIFGLMLDFRSELLYSYNLPQSQLVAFIVVIRREFRWARGHRRQSSARLRHPHYLRVVAIITVTVMHKGSFHGWSDFLRVFLVCCLRKLLIVDEVSESKATKKRTNDASNTGKRCRAEVAAAAAIIIITSVEIRRSERYGWHR